MTIISASDFIEIGTVVFQPGCKGTSSSPRSRVRPWQSNVWV